MKTQPHIIFLLICICFLQSSCKKQNDNKSNLNINKKDIPKKLDTKKILMFKSLNKQEYIANDTLFKLEDSYNRYIETTKPIHENLLKQLAYNKKNLLIQRAGYSFSNISIGVHKFYDENGNLIKEINYDENYNFTIYDLIKKIKKEYKIDLNKDLKRIEVSRGINGYHFHAYTVSIPIISKSTYPTYRIIALDGTFGFIISDFTYTVSVD